MKKIVLVHGMSCLINDCFGKEMIAELQKDGFEIFEPKMTIHPNITLQSWIDGMDEIASNFDENTIFLCHSLGTNFILKYLNMKKLSAKAIVCVGGGFIASLSEISADNLYLKNLLAQKEDFMWAIQHCKNRFNVFNKNDDVWTQKQINEFNENLDCTVLELPYGGHFGRRSGVKNIPEVVKLLKTIK